jgi:hypothetical protein
MRDEQRVRGQDDERAADRATPATGDRIDSGSKLRQASGAREGAEIAKQHEVAAHARAIDLHERAAVLQDRLGDPDRAATAREHAEHARQLHALALAEQHVAATFELSAKVRERMAARGGAAAEYHRMRGDQHRRIAEFERRQAQALREGYLLETPPHLGADIPPQRW